MKKSSNVRLSGETVTISYIADPAVGHGQFLIDNQSNKSINAKVEEIWLDLGNSQQPLQPVTIYDMSQEKALNPKDFSILPKAVLNFLVGFPQVMHEPHFGETCSVFLKLVINGTELTARSPIRFERRHLPQK
jgi:hypothetical protein